MHLAEGTHVVDDEAVLLDWRLESLLTVPGHVPMEAINLTVQCHAREITHWIAILVPSATRMKSYTVRVQHRTFSQKRGRLQQDHAR